MCRSRSVHLKFRGYRSLCNSGVDKMIGIMDLAFIALPSIYSFYAGNVRKNFAELFARVEIKTYILMVFWAKFCYCCQLKTLSPSNKFLPINLLKFFNQNRSFKLLVVILIQFSNLLYFSKR